MSNEYTIIGDQFIINKPQKITEFTFILNDIEYTVPCVEHEQNGVMAALAATTVSLHQQMESVLYRVSFLELQVQLLIKEQLLLQEELDEKLNQFNY